jgi:uncharacterized membrane protein YbhN (UPF0104 family)
LQALFYQANLLKKWKVDIKVKKRLIWAIIFSIGFMVFLLTRVKWEEFNLIVSQLSVWDLLIAFGVFTFGNLVRALRFHKLDHTGEGLLQWWNLNAFYNLITATLPGGAGEAATAYALKRFSMLNMIGAFRMILLSRLMDVFAISAVFFISALFIGTAAPYRETVVWISGSMFLVSLSAIIPYSEQFVMRLLQKLPSESSLIIKLRKGLSELINVSEEQRTGNAFSITLVQSIVMIIAAVVSTYFVLRSLGIEFTYMQTAYCFGVYAIFQIVPVQGIAGIGTQAAWWALALNAAGYHATDAIALGFVLHGAFYVFIAIMGMSALLIMFVNQRSDENPSL